MTLLRWAWNAETAEKRCARMTLVIATFASGLVSAYILMSSFAR